MNVDSVCSSAAAGGRGAQVIYLRSTPNKQTRQAKLKTKTTTNQKPPQTPSSFQ